MGIQGNGEALRRNSRLSSIGAAFVLAIVTPAEAANQPWVEDAKVEFQLPDLQGRLVDSSDREVAGKVLLVDLWATWCPPCISEIPTFVELQSRFRDRGLIIVAIAFEAEERPDLRRKHLQEFIAEHGINYLVLDGGPPEDFESALPSVRNVRGFPVEILVDRTGRVAKARNGYGFKKSWARKLDRDIDSLLGAPSE
jgi:thiol-disulfide isomerase/thioredoxin